MQECLKRFVRRGDCPLVELVATELGTADAWEAKNRIWVQGQQRMQAPAATGQGALLHRIASEHKLNDSQRAALAAVLGQHIHTGPAWHGQDFLGR